MTTRGNSCSLWPQKMFINLVWNDQQSFLYNYPSHSFCVCEISIHCFIIELQYNHILILWHNQEEQLQYTSINSSPYSTVITQVVSYSNYSSSIVVLTVITVHVNWTPQWHYTDSRTKVLNCTSLYSMYKVIISYSIEVIVNVNTLTRILIYNVWLFWCGYTLMHSVKYIKIYLKIQILTNYMYDVHNKKQRI